MPSKRRNSIRLPSRDAGTASAPSQFNESEFSTDREYCWVAEVSKRVQYLQQVLTQKGRSAGRSGLSLFPRPTDPTAAFALAKPVLERAGYLPSITAAYREVYIEIYTVIWPAGSKPKFEVA